MIRRINNPHLIRRITVCALLFVVLGLVVRKPLLIAYHRSAMVGIWQAELGISQPLGLVVSIRQFLNLPVVRNFNPESAASAFSHREALLGLGYFAKRTFTLLPVLVDSEEYRLLGAKVAAQAGQTPTVAFVFDQPAAPTRVSGLVVYATPGEMQRWEEFVTTVANRHE